MKIIKPTEDKLIIKPTNSPLVTLFFLAMGIKFMVMGTTFPFQGELNTLKCDRTEPKQISCQLSRQSVRGEKIITVNRLYQAELGVIEVHDDEGRATTLYRVELITSEGIIPLTTVYTGGTGDNTVEQLTNIVNFIQDVSQNSLTIRSDNRISMYLVGLVLLIVGLLLIMGFLELCTRKSSYIFNKEKNLFILQIKSIFQNKKEEYLLSQIQQAVIEEKEDSDGDTIVKPKIILNQNVKIALDFISGQGESEIEEAIKTINNFLGLIDQNKYKYNS